MSPCSSVRVTFQFSSVRVFFQFSSYHLSVQCLSFFSSVRVPCTSSHTSSVIFGQCGLTFVLVIRPFCQVVLRSAGFSSFGPFLLLLLQKIQLSEGIRGGCSGSKAFFLQNLLEKWVTSVEPLVMFRLKVRLYLALHWSSSVNQIVCAQTTTLTAELCLDSMPIKWKHSLGFVLAEKGTQNSLRLQV